MASRFLTQLHDVPRDYKRSAVIGVPGDYLYFKNKDDYPKLAKGGGWQGENCIYMGQDALGRPHYSGLGLGWKTEFALRMFLGNAYFNDCNAGFLADLRAGKTPKSPPAIVDYPETQVRFTGRAVMRYPELTAGPPPNLQIPTEVPKPLNAEELRKRLQALGFQGADATGYSACDLPLGNLIEALEFPESAMHQDTSAGMDSASLIVKLGDWALRFEPRDAKIRHLSTTDHVDADATFAPI